MTGWKRPDGRAAAGTGAPRRKPTSVTVHHRYRLDHGIYPEPMQAVVRELCDEIERLQQVVEEIDAAFFAWRQKHYTTSRSGPPTDTPNREAHSTNGVEMRERQGGVVKVVINKCFGGFGLSQAAERAYLARKGKEAFFYAEDRSSAERPGDRDLVRVEIGAEHGCLFTYTSTRDFGERVDSDTFWNRGGPTPDTYFYGSDVKRDDPDLVAVVEELGDEASGEHASLAVVEVPDHARWEISEYDGLEHVAEAHRTWA